MKSVITACVEKFQRHAYTGSALHFRHMAMEFSLGWASTNPHRLNKSPLRFFLNLVPLLHLTPSIPSKRTLQLKISFPSLIHNALHPFQHNDPLHNHHPHPPFPHNLNTNKQHKSNESIEPCPRTGRSPNLDPPTCPGSRHMSNTTHGVPALRATAGLCTGFWLPAGKRGHTA